MQCDNCRGSGTIRWRNINIVGEKPCPICGGTGVLYTQAELDALKAENARLKEQIGIVVGCNQELSAEIEAKDREIETLKECEKNLVSIIGYEVEDCCRFCIDNGKSKCAIDEILDAKCVNGIIEWARQQVEEGK